MRVNRLSIFERDKVIMREGLFLFLLVSPERENIMGGERRVVGWILHSRIGSPPRSCEEGNLYSFPIFFFFSFFICQLLEPAVRDISSFFLT